MKKEKFECMEEMQDTKLHDFNLVVKILYKLNKLFEEYDIDYELTGTTALSILGLTADYAPQDIDVRVNKLTKEQRSKMEALQSLCDDVQWPKYPTGDCFTINVMGVKVNIIDDVNNEIVRIGPNNRQLEVTIEDNCGMYRHSLKIHKANIALYEKMKLGRPKDYKWAAGLIANITSLFKREKYAIL